MGTIFDVLQVIEDKVLTRSAAENKTFKEILDEELKKIQDHYIDERR